MGGWGIGREWGRRGNGGKGAMGGRVGGRGAVGQGIEGGKLYIVSPIQTLSVSLPSCLFSSHIHDSSLLLYLLRWDKEKKEEREKRGKGRSKKEETIKESERK